MPDWAIILVSAFGGGLAGAVLQPMATYIMERVRAGEDIRRRRERSLRRMLAAQLAYGRRLMAVRDVHFDPQFRSMTPLERLEKIKFPEGFPAWEPERIADDQVRRIGIEYNWLAALLLGALSSDAPDEQKTAPLCARLRSLQTIINQRMDELNWPEVDE